MLRVTDRSRWRNRERLLQRERDGDRKRHRMTDR